MINTIVSLEDLDGEKYGQVICYPKYSPKEFIRRVNYMMDLDIKALHFRGNKTVREIPVLGKGCTSVVVLAIIKNDEKAALKICRTDSDEVRISHEARMLQIANSVEVGPRLLGCRNGLLLMEYIEGKNFSEWIMGLSGDKYAHLSLRNALMDLLEQCWRLDVIGLDHGELSRADKHIIVDVKGKMHIVDFESASVKRKTANVTSISQYLFIKSRVSGLLSQMLGRIEVNKLVSTLRTYKMNHSRENFRLILDILGV
ncbi:serine/threonine protein kinase [Candidatus Bathyarchaeota archaeon]|nr:serine/threonine protein kinase [Candidatus Bathyarchaeota archaeon]